ncbi:MAG: hypothetical protein KJ646_00540 [Nanoarchaeota archaeon]|nr:hypothetical protein [Nanoarchaeota archaeon]
MHVIIFLVEYKTSLNSNSIESSVLEENFSYAIRDFLEDRKNPEEYKKLKEKYNLEFFLIEKVGNEYSKLNKKYAKRLLKKLLKNDKYDFVNDIYPYLIPFY